jgi:hypothetical protein
MHGHDYRQRHHEGGDGVKKVPELRDQPDKVHVVLSFFPA